MHKFILAIFLTLSPIYANDMDWINTICLTEKHYQHTIKTLHDEIEELKKLHFPPTKDIIFEREIVENNLRLLRNTIASVRTEYAICKKHRKLKKK